MSEFVQRVAFDYLQLVDRMARGQKLFSIEEHRNVCHFTFVLFLLKNSFQNLSNGFQSYGRTEPSKNPAENLINAESDCYVIYVNLAFTREFIFNDVVQWLIMCVGRKSTQIEFQLIVIYYDVNLNTGS